MKGVLVFYSRYFPPSSQPHRNLSQLPNFAFSLPLALFHSTPTQVEGCRVEGEREEEGVSSVTRADEKLQEALIMFPSVRKLHFLLLAPPPCLHDS